MKAAVTLRLRPSRTEFQAFFSYSDAAVRAALLAAGLWYDAAARGYLLPATPAAVAQVQAACTRLGLQLVVPPTLALATEPPPPTQQQELLARYCQFIALKRYSPATLRNYRGPFSFSSRIMRPASPCN